MIRDQRGVSGVAILLLVFLLVAIIGVSTVLVGRALGWWTYADLPVVGRFFPAGEEDPPGEEEDPQISDEGPSLEDTVADLTAQLTQRELEIDELNSALQQRDEELARLNAQVEQLIAQSEEQSVTVNEEKWRETAKMLQNMRAEQAAAIVSHYDDQQILQVLGYMSAESAGGILSKMDPERAARVTASER